MPSEKVLEQKKALVSELAEKLKDATQPEVPKIPENDVKRKTAEILEDLELI